MPIDPNSFTGDVVTLLSIQGKEKFVATLPAADDDVPLEEFLRAGIMSSVYPYIQNAPPFVQQVLGRVLVEEVNWKQVAEWARSGSN